MKRLGFIVLLIVVLAFTMGYSNAISADEDIGLSSVSPISFTDKNLMVQDLLNVEFEATYQAESGFVTHYVFDNDRGIEVDDVEYIFIGNLQSERLRASVFL